MIDRVEALPRPDPNVAHLLTAVRHGRPPRVPMLELKFDDEIAAGLLDEALVPWNPVGTRQERRRCLRQHIHLWHRLGYDAFRLRVALPLAVDRIAAEDTAELSRGRRAWQNEHTGCIRSKADIEAYRWPSVRDIDFSFAEAVAGELPDGMACLGFSSGVFEWSSWMMGLESFALALYDAPYLVREVVDRVGQLIHEVFETFVAMDHVCALWLADDLGFKTGTLIGAEHLRQYILPWHRRYAELAHRHNLPFLLHSCGQIDVIMPDLVEDVGIDARHSFEDVIEPVESIKDRWGDQVAVLGGVDMDILSRGTERDVIARTQRVLEHCAPSGGYACGSGNSVSNYVPIDNYLAMVEAVMRFNGRL